MSKVFIIAEAGVNHNGDIEIAKKLIEKAKEVGANAVKFQSFTADGLLSEDVKLEHVKGGSLKNFFNSVSLSYENHQELKKYCDDVGIEFMSTPFDFGKADLLNDLGVNRFKVASCDINNLPFLKYIAKKGKTMIVSTGTAAMWEIKVAYDMIREHLPEDKIYMLHCVSNYPTKLEDANINRMIAMKQLVGNNVGYSDHTQGIIAALVAVSHGAKVIERHFTLDNNMDGPDHLLSSDPLEFGLMVGGIERVEKCLNGNITEEEKNITPLIRRSIVAARDIEAGEILSADEITYKRPGTGLAPGEKDNVVGKIANADIKENEQIKIEKLK